jgi:anti-sigma B factor antagonist
MAQLDLHTEEADGGVTVRLAGELDLSQGERFREELARAEEREPQALIVDLRGVTFMDSTGLRLLLGAMRSCEEAGRRFTIVRGQQQVQDLFRVAGLEDVFEIIDDPSEI